MHGNARGSFLPVILVGPTIYAYRHVPHAEMTEGHPGHRYHSLFQGLSMNKQHGNPVCWTRIPLSASWACDQDYISPHCAIVTSVTGLLSPLTRLEQFRVSDFPCNQIPESQRVGVNLKNALRVLHFVNNIDPVDNLAEDDMLVIQERRGNLKHDFRKLQAP